MKLPSNYFLFLLVALSFSCSKDKPEPPTYYLTQDMYDYVIFPVGSWWVYKDSVTGVLDTVKVISQEKKITEHDGDGNGIVDYKWEELSQNLSNTFPVLKEDIFVSTASNFEYNGTCNYYLEPEYGIIVNQFISDISPEEKTTYAYIFYISFYNSIIINNISYSKIKKFKYESINDGRRYYNIVKKYNGILYYSKNIGLIKRNFGDSLKWELINYHINK